MWTHGAGGPGTPVNASAVAVVAHPDDDLLFLNPDHDRSIAADVPTTTVYVTAGDALLGGAAGRDRARSRQHGIQDAYRLSTGVTDLGGQGREWDGAVVTAGGRRVEEFTLRERPSVRLVFMGLPDGHLTEVAAGGTVSTVPATDGLVTASQDYDAQTVITVLTELMGRYEVTVLRVTEVYVEARYDVGSHPDHRAAAPLAVAAAGQYRASANSWLPYVVEYHDYENRTFPVDLDEPSRSRKRAIFDAYKASDPNAIDDVGWGDRCWYRRPNGTQWSLVDPSGAVHLVVVRGGRALSWHGDGSVWTGPVDLDLDAVTVTAVVGSDGTAHVAARTDDHRICVRPLLDGDWTDLGNPSPGVAARDVGSPVLAPNADGRLQVFLVDADGALESRWQNEDGSWNEWVHLGGSDLIDPCAAVLGVSGRIEVAVASRTGLSLWRQDAPNGAMSSADIPAVAPASAVSMAVNDDGRLEVHYRETGSAAVGITWQDADTEWRHAEAIGGPGGVGQPATTTVAGRITTVVRNSEGGVSAATQTVPNGAYGEWQDLGGQIVDYPTATATSDGRLMVAAVHADGSLQQTTRSADGVWEPWSEVAPAQPLP